jgi:hypothetical protein
MRITIVTAAWMRPKRFELCLRNWTTLNPKPEIVVVGSPGDPVTETLAREYGCQFSLSTNNPLGSKWNDAVQRACELAGDGYFMIQGSDDLISQKMWDYYSNFTGDYLCLKDYYFYNLDNRQYLHWKGFGKGKKANEPIGSGKLMRYDFLKKCNFRPFNSQQNRALDYAVHASMIAAGAQPTLITCAETGGINLDLKTKFDGANMNKFQKWNNSQYIHLRHIQEQHPDIWELIQSYYG